MLSGLAIDDNDPLTRRDEGLEFLDVTSQLKVTTVESLNQGASQIDEIRIANTGPSPVDTHLLIIVRGLSGQVSLENASGTTRSGNPYIRVFLHDGVLQADTSIRQQLIFTASGRQQRCASGLRSRFPVGTG